MGKGRRTAGLAATVLAFTVFSPANASAAGVPQGIYGCYTSGGYHGQLTVKSSEKYVFNGTAGKYKFRRASKTIKFSSGALTPWKGALLKENGEPLIKLVTQQGGGLTSECYLAD